MQTTPRRHVTVAPRGQACRAAGWMVLPGRHASAALIAWSAYMDNILLPFPVSNLIWSAWEIVLVCLCQAIIRLRGTRLELSSGCVENFALFFFAWKGKGTKHVWDETFHDSFGQEPRTKPMLNVQGIVKILGLFTGQGHAHKAQQTKLTLYEPRLTCMHAFQL